MRSIKQISFFFLIWQSLNSYDTNFFFSSLYNFTFITSHFTPINSFKTNFANFFNFWLRTVTWKIWEFHLKLLKILINNKTHSKVYIHNQFWCQNNFLASFSFQLLSSSIHLFLFLYSRNYISLFSSQPNLRPPR